MRTAPNDEHEAKAERAAREAETARELLADARAALAIAREELEQERKRRAKLEARLQRLSEARKKHEDEADAARIEAEVTNTALAEVERQLGEAREALTEARAEIPVETPDEPPHTNGVSKQTEKGREPATDAIGEKRPKPGLSRRLRRRSKEPFIGRPGHCSVCSRKLQVESAEELRTIGWLFSGRAAVCTSCQEDGWELPPNAVLPLRRSRGI